MARHIKHLAATLALAVSLPGLAQAQDAAAGEQIFKKCMACHRIGEGAKNLIGPALTGVVGRTAGTAEGFSYSPLNKSAGEAGLVWTADNIIAYLPDPNAFLKGFLESKGQADKATGSTKMTFKLASDDERKNVVAYLQTFSKK